MNKKLLFAILIVILILLVVVFVRTEPERIDNNLIQARETAKSWVESSAPTYVFDGENLELLNENELEENSFEFLFSFETRSAGYGDRTDQMVAQVITSRNILVVVEQGEVTMAITDGIFDEIEERMITVEEVEEETMIIKVYFGQYGQDTGVFAIEREVEKRQDVAMTALEELLKGPMQEEYFTSIPEGVQVQRLVIEDGVAKVDFSSELDEVAGSATVMAIREQIEKTLLQFPTVEEVLISIDGRTEDILQP